MSTEEKESPGTDKPSLFPNTKDVIGFLNTLIQIILPKHTVIIIILGIMGYFLFYPMVRDIDTYKNLMSGPQWSPFMLIYFGFGLVYLAGWMGLTYAINSAGLKNDLELKKAEIESSRENLPWVIRYLVENLWFPEEQIKREVSLKIGHGTMRLDLATYDENNSPLAIVEAKWSKLGIQNTIKQFTTYISATSAGWVKGWYLFINESNGFEVRFYDSKWEETGTIPTYKELLKIVEKKK